MTIPLTTTAGPPKDDTDALLRDAARSRLLRRLASSMRHDLNSPLQAAVWAFDLIERGIASLPDAQQRDKVVNSAQLGRRELARLRQSVQLFLACAAPLDDAREAFDLRAVLAEVEEMIHAESALRDVSMRFPEAGQSIDVFAVRHQIHQALLLLALEALDAAGAGGEVQIEVEGTPDISSATVRISHGLNLSDAAPFSDLIQRVTDAVAAGHGGTVVRSEHNARREISFRLAKRTAQTPGEGIGEIPAR